MVPVNKTRRLSAIYVAAVKGRRTTRRKRSPNRPTIDSLPCKVAHSIQRERKEMGYGERRGERERKRVRKGEKWNNSGKERA